MAQQGESILIKKFERFFNGYSPVAHLSSLVEIGNGGHASAMQNVDILTPDYITQGPALTNLTAGTQAAAVTELIKMITDQVASDGYAYGIGSSKLFQITASAVTNAGSFPQAITSCTDGNMVIELKGNLYYFFNKSSGGEIGKFDLVSIFDHDWGSTVPTGAAALQKNLHPADKTQTLIGFGNGRYFGLYNVSTTTLAPTKLDFGNDAEVADVVFKDNYWQIAVNYGPTGTTKRNKAEIVLYDPSGVSSLISDQLAVGAYKIGFMYPLNGVMFVAYQDLSLTNGYKIGYVSGKSIKPLGSFAGALPLYYQKTLFKNTILFLSNGLIFSSGSVAEGTLPYQISQIADGGYATCGALAAPFGTPMVASTDGGSNFRLAQFSGYDVSCNWRSVVIPTVQGKYVCHLDYVVVRTKVLGASARCDLQIEYNQAVSSNTAIQITGTGATRFVKPLGIKDVEDFRIFLNYANGSASNDCAIKDIQIFGHWIDKPGS